MPPTALPTAAHTHMAAAAATGAVQKTSLYRNCVQTQHDHMTLDDYERKTTHHDIEHVCHMPDAGNGVPAVVDITNALDKAL